MGIVSEERIALLQLFRFHFKDMQSRQLKDKTVNYFIEMFTISKTLKGDGVELNL